MSERRATAKQKQQVAVKKRTRYCCVQSHDYRSHKFSLPAHLNTKTQTATMESYAPHQFQYHRPPPNHSPHL